MKAINSNMINPTTYLTRSSRGMGEGLLLIWWRRALSVLSARVEVTLIVLRRPSSVLLVGEVAFVVVRGAVILLRASAMLLRATAVLVKVRPRYKTRALSWWIIFGRKFWIQGCLALGFLYSQCKS